MRRVVTSIAICTVLCSVAVTFAANPFSKTTEGVQWKTTIFEAHKTAKEENKPMLVVFGADWCTFCKKLEKETLNTPQMAKYINENYVPVHLDADKDKKIAEILQVGNLPCSVILSPTADQLARIEGYFTVGPYYQKLTAARQIHMKNIQQTSVESR